MPAGHPSYWRFRIISPSNQSSTGALEPHFKEKKTMSKHNHPAKGPKAKRKPDPIELGEGHPYRQAIKNWHERDAKDTPEAKAKLDSKGKYRG
jgi:hypothetical protein